METKEYYGGTYPSPDEIKTKNVKIKINVTYEYEGEFPTTMDEQTIKEWVEEEFRWLDFDKKTIEEIEVY